MTNITINGVTRQMTVEEQAAHDARIAAIPEETTIGAVDFIQRFTIAEEVAIEGSADPAVRVFYKRLNDPRVLVIDLSNPTVVEGVQYLEVEGLLEEGRANEILSGA